MVKTRKDRVPSDAIKRSRLKIAKTDIVVQKAFYIEPENEARDILESEFFEYAYRISSRAIIRPAILDRLIISWLWKKKIGRGWLHSYKYPGEIGQPTRKCVIPKGTLYYETTQGYASKKLRLW